jgi:Tol biopolymer transport system component
MSLTTGTRLGPFEVVAALGAGGMGEVYRARDTKLGRDVALKVLPDAFAADADRTARFQREAHVLASLNHPHIAHVYGFEEANGIGVLVMELVDGMTLADRIARGPIPLEEALAIAKQIVDALEAAHDIAIIHRDLKPANIKVRDDGTVKVLDFGLAKILETEPRSPSHASMSPTLTSPAMMTGAGLVLGTAAYMSPEQARGRPVDKRADIWAFGCVLYEMLAGNRAFEGEEMTDVLAAVVRADPDWTRLPADTPAPVRRLLRRVLEKDRKRRLADISDARFDLVEIATDDPGMSRVRDIQPARRQREYLWMGVAVAAILLSAALALRLLRTPSAPGQIARFEIVPPPGGLDFGQPLSPDGRTVAFITRSEARSQLWVRPLDSASARPLPGTDHATRNFWSPDGQHIGFFAEGNLKRIGINGGQMQLIANGPFRDGAWNADGVVLVGGQQGRALLRVSERGGQPVAETVLDPSLKEISHDYPEFLPDGRHYVYLARTAGRSEDWVTYVGALGSRERRPLPGIHTATKYSPTGHLLFLRGTLLMAQAFDRDRLELSGEAFPIAEDVGGNRVGTFSTSHNGSLAFHTAASSESQLTLFDRNGVRQRPESPVGVYRSMALSRDGRFVAFDRGSPSDVWVMEVERASSTSRVTSDRAGNRAAVWSPGGKSIAFASSRGGSEGVYEHTMGSTAADRQLLHAAMPPTPSDWSADGRYLAYAAGGDVWALPVSGPGEPLQLTATPFFREQDAMFSPDGAWIAYASDESSGVTRSGEGDIFVQSFPQRGFLKQVSTGGGVRPRWSRDGRELFYIAPDGTLTAVSTTPRAAGLDIGTPMRLFQPGFGLLTAAQYTVTHDGRFLVNIHRSEGTITVILNWFDQLKATASVKAR